MDVITRFLHYISYETTSDPDSISSPSTKEQLAFGKVLADELKEIGFSQVELNSFGIVYGHLPATPGFEYLPAIGLIAHMDTSPDASGFSIEPRILSYQGGDIVLNKEKNIIMRTEDFESLAQYIGQNLIITDGTTLLGADDKAGIAEIVTALEYFLTHSDISHGPIAVAFTPDEEIGHGTDHFDLSRFGCSAAYTIDGGELGEIEYENFNAAHASFLFHGIQIHPGSAKNKMRNAVLMAVEAISLLPPAETPSHTEGYEGFYHVHQMKGSERYAEIHLLIRDHDYNKFEQRKIFLQNITDFMQKKYGKGTVELIIEDSYYNMKEKILPHFELIKKAETAMKKVGINPVIVPIRGGTDGARLSYDGIPCPNLCTGGLNFHGIYEYIPTASLKKMVEVLIQLFRYDGK